MGWTSGAVLGVLAASLVVLAHSLDGGSQLSPDAQAQSLLESPVLNRRARETLGTFGLLGALFVQRSSYSSTWLFAAAGRTTHLANRRHAGPCRRLSPFFVRLIGVKFTVAAGLASIAGGLWQVSTVSTVTTTYGQVVPGLLCSVSAPASCYPRQRTRWSARSLREIRIGSASNAVALQVVARSASP